MAPGAGPAIPQAASPAAAGASKDGADDRSLAAIVAALVIPESEKAPPVEVPTPTIEPPKPKPDPKVAEDKAKADAEAARVKKDADAEAVKAKADAAKAKKEADAAKAKKEAAKKKKEPPKPKNPSRSWVQVAGGANKATLPKEWVRLRTAQPKLFAGLSAWTTPLRATNRLLVGPFPSDDAAQIFVNKMKAVGLPAFGFTSAEGQVVEPISSK